ncbi:MAG: ferritin-like protein [Bryobacterales bacterium]|nr:ferritin-like protein [Bryobacterales bacterium]
MDQQSLQELLVDNVRDIYDAEKQLVKALPKMAKAADSEELADAIREHLEQTQNQVGRLENIFEMLGIPAKGKPCKGMRGLIEEGSEALEEDEGVLRDLEIIAGAQKVEHYEIAAYGTARTIAERLGNDDAAKLLQETEDEEKAADSKLSEIAMSLYEVADMEESETDSEEEETTKSRKPARSNAGQTARRASH